MSGRPLRATWTLATLLNSMFVASVSAQESVKPANPALERLNVFVGEWTYSGEQVDPPVPGLPFGPAGKFSGKVSHRFILNGFFLEAKMEDANPGGETSVVEITGYDAKAKQYVVNGFTSDGTRNRSTQIVTADGRVWTANSTTTTKSGDEVLVRTILKFSADGTSHTSSAEVSADGGKTWKPWYESKAVKAGLLSADQLVGTWRYVSGMRDGEAVAADRLEGQSVEFTKEQLTLKGEATFVLAYEIDAKASPATISMEITESPFGAGMQTKGVVRMTDGLLQICYPPAGGATPGSFDAAAGSGNHSFTLKRE